MRLLLDENLSRRIVPLLEHAYPGSTQVVLAGLERASDRDVWEFARAGGYVIVTKDDDFFHLASHPQAAVQVVWVRLGNCRKATLPATFDTLLPRILEAPTAGSRVVEVR